MSAKASKTHSEADESDDLKFSRGDPEPEVCNKSKLSFVGRKDILHMTDCSLCGEVQAYCKISFLILVGTFKT